MSLPYVAARSCSPPVEANVPKSSHRIWAVPPKTVLAQFDQAKCEALRAILHKPPHVYGKQTSIWTLALASDVCFEQGLTESVVGIETIRQALLRLGVGWQRAKHWITSPDPD